MKAAVKKKKRKLPAGLKKFQFKPGQKKQGKGSTRLPLK